VPHAFAHIGQELKYRRETRGESLAHVSNITRIPASYLRAIENLDEANLPAMGYAVGYARAYGKEMGLAGDGVVERFKADLSISHIAAHQGPKRRIKPRPIALPKGVFSGLAVSLFAGSLALWFGVQADDAADAAQTLTASPSYEVREQAALPDDIYRLTALRPSLVEIRDRDGDILIRRILTPGQTWEGAAQAGLAIFARDGSALTLERGTQNFGALTPQGILLDTTEFSTLEVRLSEKIAAAPDL